MLQCLGRIRGIGSSLLSANPRMKLLVILAVVVVVASARAVTKDKRANGNRDNSAMNAANSIIASANDKDKQNSKDKRDYEYYYYNVNYDDYGLYAVGAVVDYGYVDYSAYGLYYYDVSQDDIDQKLAAKEARKN